MPFGPHPTDSAGDMRGSGTMGGIYIAVAGLPEFFSRDQGPARKYAFRLFEACALLCRVIFRHRFRGGFPVDFSGFLQSQQFGFFRPCTADNLFLQRRLGAVWYVWA